ncbi:unnamed protein product [Didymodactylos carnosus]|uniref:BURP domain-containing protein n=1 Tax=Didymodactylos carnosus TaxID=1234261 RepID=A0A815VPE9_9BILA|nr:unnamed protein product [Didymodactylos carnosus]CAF4392472.1 unnamed protein product [Didymodactylos carnosus]
MQFISLRITFLLTLIVQSSISVPVPAKPKLGKADHVLGENGDLQSANTGIARWAVRSKLDGASSGNNMGHQHSNQNLTTGVEREQLLGMYHVFEDFAPHNTISVGGYWSNVNMTGNLYCEMEKVPICQELSAVNEHRRCFRYQNENERLNYGSLLLNTSDIKIVTPDRKMYLLPFPHPFNITVVKTTPIAGCQNNPITCHPIVSNGCLVYVCHVLQNTKAFQVTVNTEGNLGIVDMIAICHYETAQFIPAHVAFRLLNKAPGDVVCHFVGVPNHLMCKNEKQQP